MRGSLGKNLVWSRVMSLPLACFFILFYIFMTQQVQFNSLLSHWILHSHYHSYHPLKSCVSPLTVLSSLESEKVVLSLNHSGFLCVVFFFHILAHSSCQETLTDTHNPVSEGTTFNQSSVFTTQTEIITHPDSQTQTNNRGLLTEGDFTNLTINAEIVPLCPDNYVRDK